MKGTETRAKKIILTGASGFLGRNLLKCFSSDSTVQVYALTSKPSLMGQDFASDNVVFADRAFLLDSEEAPSVVEGAILVNCAFPRNTDGISMAKGLKYINDLFCAAKKNRAKAVINISSQSVYSQKRDSVADETTELNLESVYATGKYASELMLNAICDTIPHSNLRLSSLIGPSFDQRITNKLIDNVITTRSAVINISERRFGFMDVTDAARAIDALTQIEPGAWKQTYCVGTGYSYSTQEISERIVELAEELLGFSPEIITKRTEEYGNTAVSGDLLKKDTGYENWLSLEDSLRLIFLSKRAQHLNN